MSNKPNKNGKCTSAANSFGAGSNLIGKEFRGKKIISATRKSMTTESGTFERKGNCVQYTYVPFNGEWDDTETEGDRL